MQAQIHRDKRARQEQLQHGCVVRPATQRSVRPAQVLWSSRIDALDCWRSAADILSRRRRAVANRFAATGTSAHVGLATSADNVPGR